MKKNIILLVIVLILLGCTKDNNNIEENIFDGDITLTTQDEVDKFGSNNYTEIIGTLYIGEGLLNRNTFIRNIDKLASLKAITKLEIKGNDNLTNINGLKNLTFVEELKIRYNISLVSIDGLMSLHPIYDGLLEILGNSSLLDLKGLNKIQYVNDLKILSNGIRNLEGLNNLTSANILYIDNNEKITNLKELNKLTKVNYLHIYGNDSLESLEGLNYLSIIGNRGLWIRQNFSLVNINGLENLIKIEGDLSIFENYKLENLDGIKNLTFVGGNLEIAYNTIEPYENGLDDLCGLYSLINNNGLIGTYDIRENKYNPTRQDIKTGNCGQ